MEPRASYAHTVWNKVVIKQVERASECCEDEQLTVELDHLQVGNETRLINLVTRMAMSNHSSVLIVQRRTFNTVCVFDMNRLFPC